MQPEAFRSVRKVPWSEPGIRHAVQPEAVPETFWRSAGGTLGNIMEVIQAEAKESGHRLSISVPKVIITLTSAITLILVCFVMSCPPRRVQAIPLPGKTFIVHLFSVSSKSFLGKKPQLGVVLLLLLGIWMETADRRQSVHILSWCGL